MLKVLCYLTEFPGALEYALGC